MQARDRSNANGQNVQPDTLRVKRRAPLTATASNNPNHFIQNKKIKLEPMADTVSKKSELSFLSTSPSFFSSLDTAFTNDLSEANKENICPNYPADTEVDDPELSLIFSLMTVNTCLTEDNESKNSSHLNPYSLFSITSLITEDDAREEKENSPSTADTTALFDLGQHFTHYAFFATSPLSLQLLEVPDEALPGSPTPPPISKNHGKTHDCAFKFDQQNIRKNPHSRW